ncbi:MAG: TonB-dependent receptor [Bacteroidota bacterium]
MDGIFCYRWTKSIGFCFLLLLFSNWAHGQGQALRGEVIDASTQAPLIGATVRILDTDPLKGGTSDVNGRYLITDIPVGRYDVEISYIGYTTQVENGVIITSGQATLLNISLTENRFELEEVTITSSQRAVMNESALLSARSFRVEELGRIPGGVDDPARMARKFPGVVPNASILANSINVRGNSSRAVMWRIGDVDIYNPSHFAVLGGSGGSITILSQRLLSNTDFYTGAFPADYGNTLGGVFDVTFRNGNMEERAHSAQISLVGIDFATEGPIGKKGRTSYLANYRYSTTSLVNQFLPQNFIPAYQDLSFKIHHQLENGAQIDFFGLGGKSVSRRDAFVDTTQNSSAANSGFGFLTENLTGTVGTTYLQPLSKNTYLKASLVGTGMHVYQRIWYADPEDLSLDTTRLGNDLEARVAFSGFINHRFSPQHTHRTGIIVNGLYSRVYYDDEPTIDFIEGTRGPLDTLRIGDGYSALVQAYSRSQFYINQNWQINAGLHLMYFAYTGEVSVEPRFSTRWQLRPDHSLSFAYGLHSQVEPFFTYISRQPIGGELVALNPDLRFNKAHHFNLAWHHQSNKNLRLGVELYYQHQYNLVVGVDVPVSRVAANNWRFEAWDLNNGGTGRNYGIEASIERSFSQGYYFLANTSLFDATYVANDGVRRNSQFNSRYIINAVGGREWQVGQKKGKKNFFGANIAVTYGGPQYFTTIDVPFFEATRGWQLDYANPNLGIQQALLLVDLGINYKVNRPRFNSEFTVQVYNALNQRPNIGQFLDVENGGTGDSQSNGIFPLIGYRINF